MLAVGERARSRSARRVPRCRQALWNARDAPVVRPHDEDRLVADRVLDEVARLRELLLAARDLPDARPEPLQLEVEERPRDVALLREEAVVTDEHRRDVVCHGRIGSVVAATFNLADLFECVADAVPEREAVVQRTDAAHVRASSTSGRPGSRTRSRELGVGPRRPRRPRSPQLLEHLEAMLACYKLRAVPINVNYRYVADELQPCSPTPTSSASCATA